MSIKINYLLLLLYNNADFILYIGGGVALLTLISEVIIHNNKNNKNVFLRKFGIILLVLCVLVSLSSTIVGFIYTKVPDIIGYDGIAAKQTLRDNHLSCSFPVGVEVQGLEDVIITNVIPSPNTLVLKDEKVMLEIYTEKITDPITDVPSDMIAVPDFTNMTEQEACELGEKIGLQTEIYWSDGTKEGEFIYYIIKQSIPKMSSVPRGTKIQLERSPIKKGILVSMPNVVGMKQSEATQLLISQGINFQVWWYEINNDDPIIVEQSVSANTQVESWSVVQLQIK